MFVLPNVSKGYPRANEFTKDLISAVIGAGILRLAGMKLEVGQLSMKTLAFGSGTVALGSAFGREAYVRYKGSDLDFNERRERNDMNKDYISLAFLTAFAAGAFALTQYSKVGAYLPTFTQLNKNQALALGGSTIGMLAGLRFFGFAKEAKAKGTPPPRVPEYDPSTNGEFSEKDVPAMLKIQQEVERDEVTVPRSQQAAWNARVEALLSDSAENANQLKKYSV